MKVLFHIHQMIEDEDVEGLDAALRAGASPDEPDPDFPDFLAIFLAIDVSNEGRIRDPKNESDLRSIRLLIAFGCSLKVTYKGETPCDFALGLWHFEAARFIEKHSPETFPVNSPDPGCPL